jgi:hypothetical protein
MREPKMPSSEWRIILVKDVVDRFNIVVGRTITIKYRSSDCYVIIFHEARSNLYEIECTWSDRHASYVEAYEVDRWLRRLMVTVPTTP